MTRMLLLAMVLTALGASQVLAQDAEEPEAAVAEEATADEDAEEAEEPEDSTLDDRATPIDRDVFLRELSFYEIRSGQ